jgi:hypothetical protein
VPNNSAQDLTKTTIQVMETTRQEYLRMSDKYALSTGIVLGCARALVFALLSISAAIREHD